MYQINLDDLSGDSQLTNSVYLDNDRMELYHGRLDKVPHAIALRLRWYDTGMPKVVFVERKTHEDSWTGELSVKERFPLPAEKVVAFMDGTHTVDEAEVAFRAEGDLKGAAKTEKDVAYFRKLFIECQQAIRSKQLQPCMRTQYMRVAYQIPFQPTVRISLDTNLCMIMENPAGGKTCKEAGRWFRDPSMPVPHDEITSFPHAVLEVGLSIRQG